MLLCDLVLQGSLQRADRNFGGRPGSPSADHIADGMVQLQEHRKAVVAQLHAWYSDGALQPDGNSHLSHSLQCARQAQLAGATEPIIVGALLHDIGWQLATAQPGFLSYCAIPDDLPADVKQMCVWKQHDVIGGQWLRMQGFDDECAHVTEGHEQAKRYLCYKEAAYYDKLSQCSKSTLALQGGPMTAEEAAVFECNPSFAVRCCKRNSSLAPILALATLNPDRRCATRCSTGLGLTPSPSSSPGPNPSPSPNPSHPSPDPTPRRAARCIAGTTMRRSRGWSRPTSTPSWRR